MSVRNVIAAFAFVGGSLMTSAAQADVYFNGALGYIANSNSGANSGGAYEYDSFITPNNDLYINGVTATPVVLTPGTYAFRINFNGPTSTDPSIGGLGLYFTTTSTLLNTFSLAPDLVVFRTPTGFASPASGVNVPSIGQFSAESPYAGNSSFTIGGLTINVTGWDGTTLNLNVVNVPAPGAAGMLAIGGLVCSRRKRA